ncbi:TIGR03087 family PEP-CTERM/XrtA system glycosyltransferase [Bowmanella sp. Y26]|uniref:TIGR03087 family PEP-CTERM/XrtA system glycosyltransferase n=1 Tax=Bowmanella yangjiangensis TaxID=2811230 RepID=UPI001BDC49F6|nr:TIGR03087 family PEP-CTERM/XrtA system glycosyltransferase [Bowmanella yangjiangensis]MBT1064828.1 TIGR03087 family PEP-CTERM/XrtA system glycosyltransferase [Bowmanella yangjiangensis]
MPKPALLYLCHRLPIAPFKGDRVRTRNQIEYLSTQFDVYLGCFAEEQSIDKNALRELQGFCKQVYVEHHKKFGALLRCLWGLLKGEPLTCAYYKSAGMQAWVQRVIANQHPGNCWLSATAMAPYVLNAEDVHLFTDFIDVDSDKWRQYAERSHFLMKWLYRREWQALKRLELVTTERSKRVYFVSTSEADFFKAMLPKSLQDKVGVLRNGVNSAYFSPDYYPCNSEERIDVVFTGAMNYRPNIDGVLWFLDHAWPLVREAVPTATFYVVGLAPDKSLLARHGLLGVVVTGKVDDVRPYLGKARIAIAPIRLARGVQNKVLEAMAMSKDIVCTHLAMEGIDASCKGIWIEDEPKGMAERIVGLLTGPIGPNYCREWVLKHHQWKEMLKPMESLINERH